MRHLVKLSLGWRSLDMEPGALCAVTLLGLQSNEAFQKWTVNHQHGKKPVLLTPQVEGCTWKSFGNSGGLRSLWLMLVKDLQIRPERIQAWLMLSCPSTVTTKAEPQKTVNDPSRILSSHTLRMGWAAACSQVQNRLFHVNYLQIQKTKEFCCTARDSFPFSSVPVYFVTTLSRIPCFRNTTTYPLTCWCLHCLQCLLLQCYNDIYRLFTLWGYFE